ncbi:hypothetical protein HY415_03050 [Candidatus Kaiserbacteria bacterium]|nr:hypothetical protein [Candidatus Kaiserbacteria bacterium]
MKLLHDHAWGGLLVSTFLIVPLLFSSSAVFAKIGVGMGAGEIRLTEPMKLGGIYPLPDLRIFNTGDEVTTYGMDVAYHQDRPELRPAEEWFSFSPATFTLEPGESQEIRVIMTVPLKAEPGDYFAFVESGPVASNKPGTSVGVAVASKLFFTVVPANIFQAILFRTSSFFKTYAPWSWVGLIVLFSILLLALIRRFFSFNIAMRKK